MKTRAIALLSGGLDSTLAVKLMVDQGIEVEAMSFATPFCNCNRRGKGCEAKRVADELGIPCRTIAVTDEFFELIKHPRHGYGSGMNPCLDCRILMFSKAKQRMQETGAQFVFTGEVLGQRPMSQRKSAMDVIEEESGLEGYLLRPLSAKRLPPTIAEQKGLVDREQLLAIEGRSRKTQMALAEAGGITDYPCPAGGCLLTDPGYARRMRDLLTYTPDFALSDVTLLRIGRHFRLTPHAKAVSGRDEAENANLIGVSRSPDLLFEVPDTGSPVTLLRGHASDEVLRRAAAITARYSDIEGDSVDVCYGTKYDALGQKLTVAPSSDAQLAASRI